MSLGKFLLLLAAFIPFISLISPENQFLNLRCNETIGSKVRISQNKFPSLVVILHEPEGGTKEFCTGTLIHLQVVLTSGSCRFIFNETNRYKSNKFENVVVKAGASVSYHGNKTKIYYEQTSSVRKGAFFADEYPEKVLKTVYFQNYADNYALLFLKEPFRATSNVNTNCLSNPTLYPSLLTIDSCYYISWGRHQNAFEQHLPMVFFRENLYRKKSCEKMYQYAYLFPENRFYFNFDHFCFTGDIINTNYGDPVFCPLKSKTNEFVQLGMFNEGFNSRKYLVTEDILSFSNLTYAYSWIVKEMMTNLR